MSEVREMPIGKLFSELAKFYLGAFSKRLQSEDINRYFYPLLVISRGKGEMSQQHLADELSLDKVSIVRIVDYLTKNNLVERKQNPKDRREQLLQVTDSGEKLSRKIHLVIQETNDISLSGFNKEEVEQFENYLSRLRCNLKQQPQHTYKVEFIKSNK